MRPTHLKRSGDFLPDLCHVKAVLALVIFAQLLSISVALAARGVNAFSWQGLGEISILVLWIMLGSAGMLCPLRGWFAQQSSWVAGSTSYILVLIVALTCLCMSQWLLHGSPIAQLDKLLTGMIISAIFAGVILRYFYLQQQLRNEQQSQLMANFNALQARIRPHFLFNSMNTIASLIMIEPATAEKMIVTLSQLLRSSLSDDAIVSLAQEITLCRDYVDMEQLRLGERLRVDWDISGITDEDRVPSLLLQPLLENAIYHGIQPLPEGGKMVITIKRSKSGVDITIVNPFFANSLLGQKAIDSGNGLALENIRDRLNALYDKTAFIAVKKTQKDYTVTLHIPRMRDLD